MKKVITVILALSFLLVAAGLASAAGKAADKSPSYYLCNCGGDCKCDTISAKPGKCKCNKKMVKMNLLAIEGDTALFCSCGGKCACKANPDDPTKCGCGKPVRKVSIKGKYVCNCGADCKCGTISDKPGKCKCGTEMKQVM